MPNGASSMRKPPLTTKGTTTQQSIMETLPAVNTTTQMVSTVTQLSSEPIDRRPLGSYTNNYFVEDLPQKFIKEFKGKLAEISKSIKERNETQKIKYAYLDPEVVENSVSI
ncbi:hypothetical protein GDO86_018922 [Hymenochirus boettgeri]|uniref:Lipoxygenase domain-containing protein n=1 Tax=Hymenochirus boettgeri TaxID=247094 RepID=A0A8T2IEI3_9PIPI|nr:hypothetical protein GDO86_018922 [Hymenochirus boettgeri]